MRGTGTYSSVANTNSIFSASRCAVFTPVYLSVVFFVLENILCLLLQRPDCGVKTSLYYFSDISVKSDLIGHVWYTNN